MRPWPNRVPSCKESWEVLAEAREEGKKTLDAAWQAML